MYKRQRDGGNNNNNKLCIRFNNFPSTQIYIYIIIIVQRGKRERERELCNYQNFLLHLLSVIIFQIITVFST